MKKRLLSVCIALALMSVLLPARAAEEDTTIFRPKTGQELISILDELRLKNLYITTPNITIMLEGKDYQLEKSMEIYLCESNLTIQGTSGTRILGAKSYHYTLTAQSSNSITLRDLAIGQEDGSTAVFEIGDCDLIIERCDIFSESIEIREDTVLTVKDSTIRDCSYGAIIEVRGDGTKTLFENCRFYRNRPGPLDRLPCISLFSRPNKLDFINCTFKDNEYYYFNDFSYLPVGERKNDKAGLPYTLQNCSFSGNAWDSEEAGTDSAIPAKPVSEYVYDVSDPGEDTKLPVEALDKVIDAASAADAVKQLTSGMTKEQKASPTGVDLATLYAETAVSKAASEKGGDAMTVDAADLAELAPAAARAVEAVEAALSSGGITTARYLAKTVTYTTDETDISLTVDPDILTAGVDRQRIETPSYALTLKIADLEEDLTEPLTFKTQELVSSYALRKTDGKTTVKIDLPKVQMTNPVIVSLPRDAGDATYQAIVKTDGTAASSKFNPAARTIDGRINASGTYTVKMNEKSFTDISGKSAEMRKAILYLTSKGIINGTSDTEFSPDNSISRQQIAALLMRALGKVDNTATTAFTDVPKSSGLYHAIASSQRHKIINGYSDNTFRGTNVISKAQIVTVSGRVLTSEMNYRAPADVSAYLDKYKDTVPAYAQSMVALATREGLVVYRTDGAFSGDKNMTRGDAAIILYRLFQRIW